MKRHRKVRLEADSGTGIDISSLIDICFLLLIYFIVTSVILPAERDLSVRVPDEGLPIEMKLDPFLITIDASGQIFSDREPSMIPLDADASVREVPLLITSLEFYKQGVEAMGQDCVVLIDADGETTSQRVVDVLNALAGLQINKVSFVGGLD